MRDSIRAAEESEKKQSLYGLVVVMTSLVLLGVLVLVIIYRYQTAAEATAVLGAVTGTIGTIAGLFFGVNVGSKGKEKAEAERKEAEAKALWLAGSMHPDHAKNVIKDYYDEMRK